MWIWDEGTIVYWEHYWERRSESTHGKNQGYLRVAITKNITELRGFIGICTYYRMFVKGFSKLTSPLTDLNKKDAFKSDEEAENSFQKMKKVMSSCPILALPNFSKPFVVECDASGGGIGDVLKQGKHPIAFERINM